MNPLLQPTQHLQVEDKIYTNNFEMVAVQDVELITDYFLPDRVFRPKRIVPRDKTFWDDFTVDQVQIGMYYQAPKNWDWADPEPHAVSQAELDAYVFDTMQPNQTMTIKIVSLRKGVRCTGFNLEGVVAL